MGHTWVGIKVRFKERAAFRLLTKNKVHDNVKAIVTPNSVFVVRTVHNGLLDLVEHTARTERMVVNVPPEMVEVDGSPLGIEASGADTDYGE